ncbi:MAG: hypothetical protein ABIF09_09655, partial [Gemmatimonadota bacterium]
HMAYLSMGATLPEGASSQLGLVDAWRVQVIRPGEGIVAEDAGPVSPDQQSVTVSLSVTLRANCEQLTIVIELSSVGEVWFRSEGPNEVCVGAGNGIQAQNLQWVGPVLGLSSTGLFFSLTEGGSPQTQLLTVSNQGGGTLTWSASEDRWWLEISPASGSLGAGQSADISVTVTDFDLTGGQYLGDITVSDPNAINSPLTALVTLDYVQKPRIGLSASTLTFGTDEGVDPPQQTLTITNVGGGTLNWTAAESVGWLVLSPLSGSLGPGQSQNVVVLVSPGALLGGTYGTTIGITAPNAANSPRSVAVGLTVRPRPRIGIIPATLSFTMVEGQNPGAQLLTISNTGGGTLNWTANVGSAAWLGLSSASGSLASGQSQNVSVSASAASFDPGVYQASITIADPWAMNSPRTVPVTLTVNQGPLIGLSATVLNLVALFGANPFEQYVTVSNAGGGVLEWQATDNRAWIQLTPSSGILGTIGGVGLAQTMTVGINVSGLTEGNYLGTITVSDPDAENSPRTIQVNLSVQARVAPVIANLAMNLVKLNDPTCLNPEGSGSRYRVTFDFSDTNGDLPVQAGSFVGTPVEVVAGFPDFSPILTRATANVDGNGFGGQARLDLCVYYNYNNGVNLWIRLEDGWSLMSNQLFLSHEREGGANSPPQGSGSQASDGISSSGSVMISGGGGG